MSAPATLSSLKVLNLQKRVSKMKFTSLTTAYLLVLWTALRPTIVGAEEAAGAGACTSAGGSTAALQIPASAIAKAPYVTPPDELWLPDEDELTVVDIMGCGQYQPPEEQCAAADNGNGNTEPLLLKQVEIGQMPQFGTKQALQVLYQAELAWKGGMGVWTQMSLAERCTAIEAFFKELASKREEMVQALMWEIGKNRLDAESEFDRTVQFANSVIQTIRTDPEFGGSWKEIGSTTAFVRRAAIGIILALGPYNYPLNEAYSALIPALLMGNICILKVPTVGGLVHLLTIEAFSKTLPAGTIHFIAGSGRATMPPLMKTGAIDGLAFIGGSKAADDLISKHPHPHRLKVFLQLVRCFMSAGTLVVVTSISVTQLVCLCFVFVLRPPTSGSK